jgi:hypothetical protein
MGGKRLWSDERIAEVRRRWRAGESKAEIRAGMGLTVGQLAGAVIHFNLQSPVRPSEIVPLPEGHPALVDRRTVFRRQVKSPLRVVDGKTVLRRGRDNRKLGDIVTKGAWKGYRIYSLTLEERATCPTSCHHWRTCMGNAMQWAARNEHGPALERALAEELRQLSVRHSARRGDGFVVRLHVLGDFYSVEYVELWRAWLRRFPRLHVWGYTAWPPSTPIGAAVRRLASEHWDRFAVRLSSERMGRDRTITIATEKQLAKTTAIVCPVETGRTLNCGTCGLCWAPAARDKTIAFILHGTTRFRSERVA